MDVAWFNVFNSAELSKGPSSGLCKLNNDLLLTLCNYIFYIGGISVHNVNNETLFNLYSPEEGPYEGRKLGEIKQTFNQATSTAPSFISI